MKTLILYSNYATKLSYYDDWVDAFKEHSEYDTICVNLFNNKYSLKKVRKYISAVDLIILHHSMTADSLKHLAPLICFLKDRKGKLIAFVGNEVNLPTIGMAAKIAALKELAPNIIATQLLQEAGAWLYKDCKNSLVVSLPHALNPSSFYKMIEPQERTLDIGTRSAQYGIYIGDNDRNKIINYFNQNNYGLKLDLGLSDTTCNRFNRQDWSKFLNNCKATISTEAGSFYLERDDELVNQIAEYIRGKSKKLVLTNKTFLYKTYLSMPSFIQKTIASLARNHVVTPSSLGKYENFAEIYSKFFINRKKSPVYSKAISSRHFDAIGTHTLNVMYPGRYNNILKPGEHYFELKKDHSNVEDLLALINNTKKINKITSEAYNFVLKNHTYKNRLDTLMGYIPNA